MVLEDHSGRRQEGVSTPHNIALTYSYGLALENAGSSMLVREKDGSYGPLMLPLGLSKEEQSSLRDLGMASAESHVHGLTLVVRPYAFYTIKDQVDALFIRRQDFARKQILKLLRDQKILSKNALEECGFGPYGYTVSATSLDRNDLNPTVNLTQIIGTIAPDDVIEWLEELRIDDRRLIFVDREAMLRRGLTDEGKYYRINAEAKKLFFPKRQATLDLPSRSNLTYGERR